MRSIRESHARRRTPNLQPIIPFRTVPIGARYFAVFAILAVLSAILRTVVRLLFYDRRSIAMKGEFTNFAMKGGIAMEFPTMGFLRLVSHGETANVFVRILDYLLPDGTPVCHESRIVVRDENLSDAVKRYNAMNNHGIAYFGDGVKVIIMGASAEYV